VRAGDVEDGRAMAWAIRHDLRPVEQQKGGEMQGAVGCEGKKQKEWARRGRDVREGQRTLQAGAPECSESFVLVPSSACDLTRSHLTTQLNPPVLICELELYLLATRAHCPFSLVFRQGYCWRE